MNYTEFLEKKRIVDKPSGFEPKELNSKLFEFQKDIVRWALRRGRSAVFADTGLGKTAMQLVWADNIQKHTDGNVLIVAPLAVSQQTIREGVKFGVDVKYKRHQDECENGITIINYEMVEHFDPKFFSGIVLDECFPCDTKIDIFNLDKSLTTRYIKDVKIGDIIYNANGEDYVKNTHKRQIDRAIQISIDGKKITCSENHPFFTMHGWRCAKDLQSTDYIMATRSAMRLLWDDISPTISRTENTTFLRSILLSEMENETTGNYKESPQQRSSDKKRNIKVSLVQKWESYCIKRNRKNEKFRSNEKSRVCSKNEKYKIKKWYFACLGRKAWRKWEWSDFSTKNINGEFAIWLVLRICYFIKKQTRWFSDLLQSRFRKSRIENSNRDRWGWSHKREKKNKRFKEKYEIEFFRVESIEVLEQGDPELEKYREADGFIYFYDIESTRHPSYSVNGLLVHNSSILKSYEGKTRNTIIELFGKLEYKLCCTATPAPNDYMELGNHSEFLGTMTRSEMLSMFFVHDGGEVQKWRLKGHAQKDFWQWLCSWSVLIKKPSDLDYDDAGFKLPDLNIHNITVQADQDRKQDGYLFKMQAITLQERQQERALTVKERTEKCVELVNQYPDEPWIIWCNLNNESNLAKKMIGGSVEIKGSDDREFKEKHLLGFANNDFKILITKPKIAGFGMNWQHCNKVIFLGLSDSFESYYQAIRRCWRFGQTKPVDCYVITADTEGAVVENIKRKEKDAQKMSDAMITNTQNITKKIIKNENLKSDVILTETQKGDSWEMRLGDCIEGIKTLPDESIDYSIFSPPFASLYTYTDSIHDLGNCKTHTEFYEHFKFLVSELLRVTASGRLLSFHCMNLPTSKTRDGVIGITDFRGNLIRMFTDAGWIYHSEVVIWKDPVVAMQRTKALGLLYKQLRKDSSMCRQGIPDYLVTMRKQGENKKRITHTHEGFPVELWQNYASPIWMDINPSKTLQKNSVREEKDERHICPLQLQVIERGIELWSTEGDLVLSPFAGIGSEGYVAVKKKRNFIGFELKKSYYQQACANLKEASSNTSIQMQLFK